MPKANIKTRELELDSLIEFSQLINSNLNLDFILSNILLSIMGKMMISKGAILIKKDTNSSENLFTIEANKGITSENFPSIIEFTFPKKSIFNIDDINYDSDSFINKEHFNYFFKIYFEKKLLGILCLGKKLGLQNEFTKNEIIFIETLLNISASSIENTLKFKEIESLNKNLNSKIHQLKSLFELSKEFNSNFLNSEKILKLLSYTLLGNFGIKEFLILSKDKFGQFYLLKDNKNINLTGFNLEELNNIKSPTILTQHSADNFLKYLCELNFELLIPTVNNNNVDNIICLGKKINNTGYSESDIEFLESIVNLSVMSIENSLLFEEFLNKQKLENELSIAREIQIALLPKSLPQIKDYDLAALNIPAHHIGGDYYDIIKLTDTKYVFAIADVSGKGTPASLLMSNIQSAVHSCIKLYDANNFDLIDATLKINELIYENTSSEKFITFFWGILDLEENTFEYLNAGHNPPYLFSQNICTGLEEGGLMIGIIDTGISYNKNKIFIQKNDTIIFYTDGVTEAQNILNEEFSEEKLLDLIQKNNNLSANSLITLIKDSIQSFSKGRNQFDDITMIVLKRIN